jgi:hypothetical protein
MENFEDDMDYSCNIWNTSSYAADDEDIEFEDEYFEDDYSN